MKNRLLVFALILALNIFYSCNTGDDGTAVDCSLFDPGPQDILVYLFDAKNKNLILDGTYNPEEIEVTANGEMAGSAVILDGGPKAFIYVSKEAAGNQSHLNYLIKLNENETDTLQVTYSMKEIDCGHKIYTAERLLYNEVEVEIVSENVFQEVYVIKNRQ